MLPSPPLTGEEDLLEDGEESDLELELESESESESESELSARIIKDNLRLFQAKRP